MRVNLRDALDAEHSKAQTLRITAYIGGSRRRFSELVEILTGTDRRLAQRAAWVVSHVAESRPAVQLPFLKELLNHLRQPGLHDAIKRNTMKAASQVPLPDEVGGLAADLAFEFLRSPDEAIATRVYSMSVLEQLCHREPALADELRLSIEHLSPFETKPAFRSRARQVLRSLDRIQASPSG